MRVLWLTGNYRPQVGGLETYIERLTESLAQTCEIGLITEPWQGPPSEPRITHFTVAHLTRPGTALHFRRAGEALVRIVDAYAPDVVHLANAGTAVFRRYLSRSLPVVATVHGNDLTAPWQRVPGLDATPFIVEGLRACEHIVAVSRHTQGLVRRWGIDTACSVIYSACGANRHAEAPLREEDHRGIRERYGLPERAPLVLTAARLVPRKGHDVVLRAMARLRTGAHWVVVGGGPLHEQLQASIHGAGLGSRVTLLGHIPGEDLAALYRSCSVFVLTPIERAASGWLDSEGFGLVFLEAGAFGKPVIGSDTSGCREAIAHGKTGLLVPAADADALAFALDRLLEDEALARSLGEAGRRAVRNAGGWERVAGEVLQLYADVLTETDQQRAMLGEYRP